ncbi:MULTISPECIES: IS110 family transposase [unclassified Flavobacterium]|uniref:IS110 family transposase n=1 Tax=unclassified Flavobacterium TaxID=196869 RepID=UPI001F148663|nr:MULTISPECIES: IS110 family transposase [unclassified Flavobacterium]UMY65615.1 IS110 family transposase [Flavobacterium sp. HJ-32-4]UMY66123.1 IS110 family transposase [Flavobacterium sp. HJ-32-4]
MSIVKQSVGIDISKSTFTACHCQQDSKGALVFSKSVDFSNDKTGFNQFTRWVRSVSTPESELVFLMEATGVYYEALAYHLYKIKKTVHVVLPNTSSHYFSSLNVKTKTDHLDAKVLSQFGVERKHRTWVPPSPVLRGLRNLTRYYVQLQEQRTALGNIKHSKENSFEVQQFIFRSNQKLIKEIDKQIQVVKKAIEKQIASDAGLQDKVNKINTIKGVGLITIATIIAETDGFYQIRNARQLASFAGYDVVQRESGTSIKGKTRISKKGNRYIRNALYFPAMVACRFNPDMKQTYLRINQNKPSKMIGQVAIQRKLLLLMYTLWKNDTVFIEGYKKDSPAPKEQDYAG